MTAEILLDAINKSKIEAVICRAPEFYGPGKTQGITNALVFENLKNDKKPKVLLRDDVLRTLVFTPDASKAVALIGNKPSAYGQTWHLPCDDDRLTYKGIMNEVSMQLGREIKYNVLKWFILKILSFINPFIKETEELLPRYDMDNIFDSSKFKNYFPEFRVTAYKEGIKKIIADYEIK